jgi:surface polysaccharide O-acyltransferase-like enzyme
LYSAYDIVYSFFSLSLFHLYFLLIIAGLYILTPKIREIIKNYSAKKLFKTILILFSLAALLTTIIYIFPQVRIFRNMFTAPFMFLGYYLFGQYVKNIKLNTKQIIMLNILYIFLVILSAVLVYLNTKYKFFWIDNFGQYFHEPFSPLIIGMSVIVFTIIMNSEEFIKNFTKTHSRIIEYAATTTLGIYLVHPFIIDVLNTYFRFDVHYISSALWLYITFKIFLVFIISFIAISIVNLIKAVIRLLIFNKRKLFYKN